MHRALKVHRPSLATCGAVLALVLAWSGAAVAAAPYSVKVKVKPGTVQLQSAFTVTASGVSANLSQLRVFLNPSRKCARTATADAAIAGDSVKISARVVGTYSKARTLTAVNQGRHYACAYLTAPAPSKLTRAQASASYTATLPFY